MHIRSNLYAYEFTKVYRNRKSRNGIWRTGNKYFKNGSSNLRQTCNYNSFFELSVVYKKPELLEKNVGVNFFHFFFKLALLTAFQIFSIAIIGYSRKIGRNPKYVGQF